MDSESVEYLSETSTDVLIIEDNESSSTYFNGSSLRKDEIPKKLLSEFHDEFTEESAENIRMINSNRTGNLSETSELDAKFNEPLLPEQYEISCSNISNTSCAFKVGNLFTSNVARVSLDDINAPGINSEFSAHSIATSKRVSHIGSEINKEMLDCKDGKSKTNSTEDIIQLESSEESLEDFDAKSSASEIINIDSFSDEENLNDTFSELVEKISERDVLLRRYENLFNSPLEISSNACDNSNASHTTTFSFSDKDSLPCEVENRTLGSNVNTYCSETANEVSRNTNSYSSSKFSYGSPTKNLSKELSSYSLKFPAEKSILSEDTKMIGILFKKNLGLSSNKNVEKKALPFQHLKGFSISTDDKNLSEVSSETFRNSDDENGHFSHDSALQVNADTTMFPPKDKKPLKQYVNGATKAEETVLCQNRNTTSSHIDAKEESSFSYSGTKDSNFLFKKEWTTSTPKISSSLTESFSEFKANINDESLLYSNNSISDSSISFLNQLIASSELLKKAEAEERNNYPTNDGNHSETLENSSKTVNEELLSWCDVPCTSQVLLTPLKSTSSGFEENNFSSLLSDEKIETATDPTDVKSEERPLQRKLAKTKKCLEDIIAKLKENPEIRYSDEPVVSINGIIKKGKWRDGENSTSNGAKKVPGKAKKCKAQDQHYPEMVNGNDETATPNGKCKKFRKNSKESQDNSMYAKYDNAFSISGKKACGRPRKIKKLLKGETLAEPIKKKLGRPFSKKQPLKDENVSEYTNLTGTSTLRKYEPFALEVINDASALKRKPGSDEIPLQEEPVKKKRGRPSLHEKSLTDSNSYGGLKKKIGRPRKNKISKAKYGRPVSRKKREKYLNNFNAYVLSNKLNDQYSEHYVLSVGEEAPENSLHNSNAM